MVIERHYQVENDNNLYEMLLSVCFATFSRTRTIFRPTRGFAYHFQYSYAHTQMHGRIVEKTCL